MDTITRVVTNERVDDIPVLLAHQGQMSIKELVNRHFPPHGHWEGASLGALVTVWLTYILSEGDHRLSYVAEWVEKRLTTLSTYVDEPLTVNDFRDDRLAIVLRQMSQGKKWQAFEQELNQRTIRVYDLTSNQVRLDATTASGYWSVSPDGLFQLGHSKDHRPDLPQLKVMLATLDPLGMPLVTAVLPGNRADDPLYVPAIEAVRQSMQRTGLLFIGDAKMAALGTRARIDQGQDFYLCPLPAVQVPEAQLISYLTPVWAKERETVSIQRQTDDGDLKTIAEGLEYPAQLTYDQDGVSHAWSERHLVVRSLQHAQAEIAGLEERLVRTVKAINALVERKQGKAKLETVEHYQEAVEKILERHKTTGLIQVDYQVQTIQRSVRRYKENPARLVEETQIVATPIRDEEAIGLRTRLCGWRVYATDAPEAMLSLEKAVLAYREQFIEERAFGRLKGKSLSLTPMYLQRDDHATGLVHLLSIGLRILTLTEYTVRRSLQAAGGTLSGLFAGNPKRSTARPTAERLLSVFKEIILTVIHEPNGTYHYLTPISPIQTKILDLMGLSDSIYLALITNDS
jgi:transposase